MREPGGGEPVSFAGNLGPNVPGVLTGQLAGFPISCRLLAKLVGTRASGLRPHAETTLPGQVRRPTRSVLGTVADLEATFPLSSPFLHFPSHLRTGQTPPGLGGEGWRALAPPRKGLMLPIARGGGDFPVDK